MNRRAKCSGRAMLKNMNIMFWPMMFTKGNAIAPDNMMSRRYKPSQCRLYPVLEEWCNVVDFLQPAGQWSLRRPAWSHKNVAIWAKLCRTSREASSSGQQASQLAMYTVPNNRKCWPWCPLTFQKHFMNEPANEGEIHSGVGQ